MALPKLNVPEYNLKLPSNGKNVKYRPFLVKEEKLLYLAMESGEQKDMIDAVKNILLSCTSLRSLKDLSTFDIEFLFLNIRGKSIGEDVEVMVTCPDDGKTQVPTRIMLDDIKIQISDDHNQDIRLDDDYTLRMKYPSLDEFIKNNFNAAGDINVDDTFDLIASCIEQVYSEEESWAASDCTKKELSQFVEQLNSSQFKDIEKFFETMPKLSHTVKVINPNTKKENEVVLEGLQSFFG